MNVEQGHIIDAEVPDPQGGNIKRRPLVVLNPTNDLQSGAAIIAVAVTTQVKEPVPSGDVLIPFGNPHPATGLSAKCVARCSWRVKLNPNQVLKIRGRTPAKQMLAIMWEVFKIAEQQ